jgi:AbrB family looped-hinge helix DNA binding protein
MQTVRVSPKYQIVIPQEVRESLGIRAGEEMQILRYENRIECIPLRSIRKMRGFLKGINTDIKREKDRL